MIPEMVHAPGDRGISGFVSTSEGLARAVAVHQPCVVAIADGASIRWNGAEPVTLAVLGRARVRLEVGGASSPVVLCTDRAELRLVTTGASAPAIYLNGFSEARVKTFGVSVPSLQAFDQSRLLVLAYEMSRPTFDTVAFSIPMVVVHDQARPESPRWPAGWEARLSDVYIGQRLVCFQSEGEAIEAARRLYRKWQDCENRYLACVRTAGAVPKVCANVVDFRWRDGTVHVELPGEDNPRPWYSTDAHHLEALTEAQRNICTRQYLDEPREADRAELRRS